MTAALSDARSAQPQPDVRRRRLSAFGRSRDPKGSAHPGDPSVAK
jgi:hypothetical protein